jgi:diaminopimelate decarboxylase
LRCHRFDLEGNPRPKGGNGEVVVSNGAITMIPLTHYCPQIVRGLSDGLELRSAPNLATVAHGCSCREDDVLYEGPLPEIHVGDYLVHYAAGAYNSNLSPDFIFETPPLVLF